MIMGGENNVPKTIDYTTCFAYKNENECFVLTSKICNKKKCPFFKTNEQYYNDRKKYKW